MARIVYEILDGFEPFTVSILPEESDNQIHNMSGIYSFNDIPEGQYEITVTDSSGCSVTKSATSKIYTTVEATPCETQLELAVADSGQSMLLDFSINIGNESLGETGFSFYTGIPGSGSSIPDRIQILYGGIIVADTLFTGTEPEPDLGTYTYTKYHPTVDNFGNVIIGSSSGTEQVTITSDDLRSSGIQIGNVTYFEEPDWGEGIVSFNRQDLLYSYITIRVYGYPDRGTGFWLNNFICPGNITTTSTTTSTTTTISGVWILADGTWNDMGIWDDTAVWID